MGKPSDRSVKCSLPTGKNICCPNKERQHIKSLKGMKRFKDLFFITTDHGCYQY